MKEYSFVSIYFFGSKKTPLGVVTVVRDVKNLVLVFAKAVNRTKKS